MADELSRRRRPRAEAETGFTLVELIVALGLFSLLLAILVAGVVGFARTATEAGMDARTSSQVGVALQRVERSVRYAESLNYPGVVSGAAYVEWRTGAAASRTGITTCTQLRYRASDGTLAMRTWANGASPITGQWSVLLSGVRGAASTTFPFVTVAAGSVSNYQGLSIAAATGLDEDTGTSTTTTTYAKNSSVESPSNIVGAGGQSSTPVCAGAGYRT